MFLFGSSQSSGNTGPSAPALPSGSWAARALARRWTDGVGCCICQARARPAPVSAEGSSKGRNNTIVMWLKVGLGLVYEVVLGVGIYIYIYMAIYMNWGSFRKGFGLR